MQFYAKLSTTELKVRFMITPASIVFFTTIRLFQPNNRGWYHRPLTFRSHLAEMTTYVMFLPATKCCSPTTLRTQT